MAPVLESVAAEEGTAEIAVTRHARGSIGWDAPSKDAGCDPVVVFLCETLHLTQNKEPSRLAVITSILANTLL